MAAERKFTSVSINIELLHAVEKFINKKSVEMGEALLPSDLKSPSAFIAESTRQRLTQLTKQVDT
ncbi:MAG: hypothetical protein LBC12_03945 [Nitrososphaerota archaeon]|nr:hypothetical protein [Nitrososphaerota archaeon]